MTIGVVIRDLPYLKLLHPICEQFKKHNVPYIIYHWLEIFEMVGILTNLVRGLLFQLVPNSNKYHILYHFLGNIFQNP